MTLFRVMSGLTVIRPEKIENGSYFLTTVRESDYGTYYDPLNLRNQRSLVPGRERSSAAV